MYQPDLWRGFRFEMSRVRDMRYSNLRIQRAQVRGTYRTRYGQKISSAFGDLSEILQILKRCGGGSSTPGLLMLVHSTQHLALVAAKPLVAMNKRCLLIGTFCQKAAKMS